MWKFRDNHAPAEVNGMGIGASGADRNCAGCRAAFDCTAGEVLGESQSGGIHDIGFALYTEMLEHAVKTLKKGGEPDFSRPLNVATEVNLHAPALLPEI